MVAVICEAGHKVVDRQRCAEDDIIVTLAVHVINGLVDMVITSVGTILGLFAVYALHCATTRLWRRSMLSNTCWWLCVIGPVFRREEGCLLTLIYGVANVSSF